MRLRPGLTVLWRRKGESQVGVDPRCAVVLEELTPGEQHVLDHLRHDPTEADLIRVGRASGVAPERVRELVALLRRSGVLDPDQRPRPPGSAVTPDEAYWSRLLPDGDGAALMARRAAAAVAVVGLDQVGMRIAMHLAEAGVGTLLLEDETLVRPSDVGPYHPRDVGGPRGARAEAVLRSTFPQLRTTARAAARPDVLVAVSTGVADPVRLLPLVREDVVHLPVVVGEVDVAVGPLVVPGEGPCTRCLDLHRTDADPAWPALATQLRASPPPLAATHLGQLGSAVAANQVLAAVDGRELVVDRASVEIGMSPLPVIRPWGVHPGCGCSGVGVDVPVGPRGAAAPPEVETGSDRDPSEGAPARRVPTPA
ncbi:thiamine biosynthesis protein ThiF [Georgenia sp. EYE_87]|uniref:thiamine biosynthesis protein ThiF n=1 Tax=Georgenia sp. EYE_87 TaxID=2853448 RepID=UPI002004A174|nr:thiamine biosynthesis protein ThiF [Georgenia sp. EYE_87]MCK6212380.1 thiamine biosynthesis protein ThiF [Georgenia sp. EYE_87]